MNEIFNQNIIYDFLPVIKNIDFGNDVDEKLRITLSIGLFVEKMVSLERASELSGKTLNEFIDILNNKNIAWNEYTEEHQKLDGDAVKKYTGKNKSDE